MKKNAFKSAIAALAVSAVALTGSAMTAFAGSATGDKYDTSKYDPTKSEIKPTVSLSQKQVNISDIATPVTMQLTVKDAEGKYAPTGFHVDYDSKLTLVERDGDIAELGDAGKKLKSKDMTKNGDHGFFVTTGSPENTGRDGVLWEFDLKLPSDAKVGDKYEVNIMYKSTETAKDLFTNVAQNDEGQLMQAWVFTNGIEQGYIEVVGPTTTTTTPPTTTTTTTPPTTTTTSTTTTTPPTSTTTTPPTTTTTTKPPTTTTTTKKIVTTTTTKKAENKNNAANTGEKGVGLAVAGLAVAVCTAFVLRKKED